MKREREPRPDRDTLGGKAVGGVEVQAARRIADEHAIEAMQTLVKVMRNPGRGAMTRLIAAQAVLKFATEAEVAAASETPADLSPEDVELMRQFLERRAAET